VKKVSTQHTKPYPPHFSKALWRLAIEAHRTSNSHDENTVPLSLHEVHPLNIYSSQHESRYHINICLYSQNHDLQFHSHIPEIKSKSENFPCELFQNKKTFGDSMPFSISEEFESKYGRKKVRIEEDSQISEGRKQRLESKREIARQPK
jgi:hypothetical protein